MILRIFISPFPLNQVPGQAGAWARSLQREGSTGASNPNARGQLVPVAEERSELSTVIPSHSFGPWIAVWCEANTENMLELWNQNCRPVLWVLWMRQLPAWQGPIPRPSFISIAILCCPEQRVRNHLRGLLFSNNYALFLGHNACCGQPTSKHKTIQVNA